MEDLNSARLDVLIETNLSETRNTNSNNEEHPSTSENNLMYMNESVVVVDNSKDIKCVNKKTLKKFAIVDSDSENENHIKDNEKDLSSCFSNDLTNLNELVMEICTSKDTQCISKSKSKRFAIIDSDSDSDNLVDTSNKTTRSTVNSNDLNVKHKEDNTGQLISKHSEAGNLLTENYQSKWNSKKNRPLIDCNSEEEIPLHNKSFAVTHKLPEVVIYNTNKKGELIPECTHVEQQSRLSTLCDSESSDDETAIRPKPYKKSRPRKQDEKPKKMSGKEAAELRKKIRSESQRMLRESKVSLPYHRPKSYSLKDFLEKRSKLIPALPSVTNIPVAVAIKMPQEQLEIVSKKLEERIKEVEDFYKSDSGDDGDEISVEIRGWLNTIIGNVFDQVEENNKLIQENLVTIEEPEINSNLINKKNNKFEFLREDLLKITPKLSGRPDDIIDLEEGVVKHNEVSKLMERFLKHTATKNIHHKHKVNLDIVSVNGGEIHKETVSMDVDDDEESVAILETPGAKLKKLREQLQNQIAQKRNEIWQQKKCMYLKENSEDNENATLSDNNDFYLDDEEEEIDMTESSLEEDEEEFEEELILEKTRKKSAFVDDEAEESEMTDELDDDENQLDNVPKSELIDNNDKLEDGFDGDDESVDESNENNSKLYKKCLRRIIQPLDEDSDEDLETTSNIKNSDPDTSFSNFTPNKIIQSNNVKITEIDNKKVDFDFLSPVTNLSGLQSLEPIESLQESQFVSPFKMPLEPSPLKKNNWESDIQQKLFQESSDSSKNTFDDSLDLHEDKSCYAKEIYTDGQVPSTQDLINICSGTFSGISQLNDKKTDSTIINDTNNEIKNFNDDDPIISQLLNEDEMALFKKKFTSPVTTSSIDETFEKTDEVNATGILDSDDEELELRKKTNQNKVIFSDDEDICETQSTQEGEIGDVEYDSEENEYVGETMKLTEFFENEAELSESEWGSADEDEKGMDDLEFEQGDADKIDESKVREDLERIHMRRLLDEDNREVKLLQELLLEDGELHGTGRERKFRWRNIDSTNDGEEVKKDDDIYLDEDEESEEQWRKMRYQREMFLKQNSQTVKDDFTIFNPMKTLKIKQVSTKKQVLQTDSTKKSDLSIKQPFEFLTKRGSFLNRSEHDLKKIAEYTKVSTSIVGPKKDNRNFVFHSALNEQTDKSNEYKRKANEDMHNFTKKTRLGKPELAVNKKSKTFFGNFW